MKRTGLPIAGVITLIGISLLVGVQGFAQGAAPESTRPCSEATLSGMYLFAAADSGVAIAGYDDFDGNGKVNAVAARGGQGENTANATATGTYTVNTDCTGTMSFADGTHFNLFIAPDGSMFSYVQTDSGTSVAGIGPRGSTKRVSD
jgi:hypothetical protein